MCAYIYICACMGLFFSFFVVANRHAQSQIIAVHFLARGPVLVLSAVRSFSALLFFCSRRAHRKAS